MKPLISINNKLLPEKVFLRLALFFGLIFVFIIPPFESFDESSHFFRSYQITSFEFVGEKIAHESGGYIPASLANMGKDLESDDNGVYIPMTPTLKASPRKILKYTHVPLNNTRKEFVDFRNTVLLSPMAYISQSIGIGIARIMHLPLLWMFYLGRLFNLMAFIAMIYYAIKNIPIYKWGVALFALMPLTLTLAASYSADAPTIAICFCIFSMIVKFAVDDKNISSRRILFLFASSIMLGLCKPAYALVTLLAIIIPSDKFGTAKRKWLFVFVFSALPFLLYACWMKSVQSIYIPFFDTADPVAQANNVLKHPIQTIAMVIETNIRSIDWLLYSFMGSLGWADNFVPKYLVLAYYLLIILNALTEYNQSIAITIKQKIIATTVFLATFFYVDMIMYLSACPVGANIIDVLTGRYYIPFIPIGLLMFYNKKLNFGIIEKNKNLVITFFLIVVFLATVLATIKRYYIAV